MKATSVALIALLIVLTAAVQRNYTKYTNLDNPSRFKQVVYLDSLSLVLVYGESNSTATAFRSYDWSPVTDSHYTDFAFAPSYVESYKDAAHPLGNLIYGSSSGQIKKKSFTSTGFTELSLWAVAEDNKNISRVTASPDASVYAAFCQEGEIVYIGDLTSTATMLETKDFSGQGPINSIRWRPNSSELIISGGVNNTNGDTRYFLSYDVVSKIETDLVFLSETTVIDMAFSSNGSKMYFIEQPMNLGEMTISQMDMFSRSRGQFDTINIDMLYGIEVRGNFLAVRSKYFEYIYDLYGLTSAGHYLSALVGTGLSTDGSDRVDLDVLQTQSMYVYKYCGDASSIYDPEADNCLACKDTCRECFKKVEQCSSCFPRQFLKDDFTCSTCEQGCYTCQSAESCQVCDEDNHWTLQDLHCTCSEGYLFTNNATCDSCSSFMSECTQCNSTDVCEACSEDYELNPETNHCDKKSGGGVLVIILIILAVIAVVVMAVLVWKWLQKKKAAKVSSALEEEALDDYEKVDN